jgi:chromosomal replication initiator protein
MNNEQLWQAVLGEMEINVSKANFTTWFKKTFISSYEENLVVVSVPNIFTKTWLEKKYFEQIIEAFKNITKNPQIKVIYKISKNEPTAPLNSQRGKEQAEVQEKINATVNILNQNRVGITTNRFGINPRYTFNSFIMGKNSELAHAACQAVATNPGMAYNPLVLYGGVGLGKTHLLHAIGNELLKRTNKILYVTSEKFSNEYINEVRSGRAKFLKDKYRNVDLLLIDDIQFMGGKEGTQEEFFHTFNELHQANKQIVVTSDRPLKSIPALEKRLLSRLEWGMVADITQPDLETRIAILQNKCQEKNYQLPNRILEYIAENIASNVRELEGILIKLITYHEFNNLTPTLDSTKHILSDTLAAYKQRSANSKDIIEAIHKYYNISANDLLGTSRKKELVKPRQIVMYLLRTEINLSFPAIGQEIGGRDHTTAIHACRKIEEGIKLNQNLAQEINAVKQFLSDLY